MSLIIDGFPSANLGSSHVLGFHLIRALSRQLIREYFLNHFSFLSVRLLEPAQQNLGQTCLLRKRRREGKR